MMSQMEPKEAPTTNNRASISSASTDHQMAKVEEPKPSEEHAYPPTSKVLVIMAGLFLVLFLVALDKLIIGVAIPSITDDFNSLNDVGWYGSSYLLTSCAFMLLVGKIYQFVNPKFVYLGFLVIFEIGSAICGAAPNSTAFILGRSIAGLGNAGLFQGAVVIIVYIVPAAQTTAIHGLSWGRLWCC